MCIRHQMSNVSLAAPDKICQMQSNRRLSLADLWVVVLLYYESVVQIVKAEAVGQKH